MGRYFRVDEDRPWCYTNDNGEVVRYNRYECYYYHVVEPLPDNFDSMDDRTKSKVLWEHSDIEKFYDEWGESYDWDGVFEHEGDPTREWKVISITEYTERDNNE
jgi:hypothetical protein